MTYLISYDITKNKTRKKVSDMLENYGIRIQYSVFQCELTKKELFKIKNDVEKLISKKTDSVYYIPVCDNCKKKIYNSGIKYTLQKLTIIDI